MNFSLLNNSNFEQSWEDYFQKAVVLQCSKIQEELSIKNSQKQIASILNEVQHDHNVLPKEISHSEIDSCHQNILDSEKLNETKSITAIEDCNMTNSDVHQDVYESCDTKGTKTRNKYGPNEEDNLTLKGFKFKYKYFPNAIRKKRLIV
mmetsp:Transcript_30171/g.34541  ORF Transcript_30171/g.34541 Transcript_30171/m.34541 type:complete len:149 (+) Transcript_30171:26-472(+)